MPLPAFAMVYLLPLLATAGLLIEIGRAHV